MTRNQPACIDNTEYLAYVRQSYLTRLRENLPKTVLEKDSWLTPPPIMQEVGGDFITFFFSVLVVAAHCGGVKSNNYIFFIGVPAFEEDLHSPHGTEIHSRNYSTEESTGTIHHLSLTILYLYECWSHDIHIHLNVDIQSTLQSTSLHQCHGQI